MDFSEYKLGEQDKVIHLETMDDNRSAATTVAQQCRRTLHIQTYDLDPLIYDDSDFIEAVRQIAVGSTRASIQILLEDSSKVVTRGHRIIELARQLSSFIEIRKINTDLKNISDAFLVGDETALVYRKQAQRYEGFVNFNDRGRCRQVLADFRDSWEKAAPDPELRRLHI
ncbi:MAG: hypothetical protein PVJ39_09915 [Gammaproteobacteria bacterium]|jgi:hypothetical protein